MKLLGSNWLVENMKRQTQEDGSYIVFSLQQFSSARIVVHGTDTDMAILCVYHISHLGLTELWDQRQNKFLAIYQIILKLSQKLRILGRDITVSLLSLLFLTGCDGVRYFFFGVENKQLQS